MSHTVMAMGALCLSVLLYILQLIMSPSWVCGLASGFFFGVFIYQIGWAISGDAGLFRR